MYSRICTFLFSFANSNAVFPSYFNKLKSKFKNTEFKSRILAPFDIKNKNIFNDPQIAAVCIGKFPFYFLTYLKIQYFELVANFLFQ